MIALADGMQQVIDVMDRSPGDADRDDWADRINAARPHVRGSVGRA
jgi:hypothetical protein